MAQKKHIQDYYSEICKLFPDVPEEDIKSILTFGFKSLYLHNSYGGDTLIRSSKFWMFCGFLTKKPFTFFEQYKKKMCIKLRVLFKKKKRPFTGQYYFALDDKQYEDYMNQHNKRGRPKKSFLFKRVMLYKLREECELRQSCKRYVFRIYIPIDLGYARFYEEFETGDAKLIDVHEPYKLKDILVTNKNYCVL